MPAIKMTKDGKTFFEVPDHLVEAARAKEYQEVFDVSKDGETFHPIRAEDLQKAVGKGYKLKNVWDAEKKIAERKPEASMLESAASGVAQGATLGFMDELSGVVGAALDPQNKEGSFGERYDQYRDQARVLDKDAAAANPKMFAAGQIGGSLAVPMSGSSLPARIIEGAAQGGLAGIGEAETKDDAVSQGLLGALMGGGFGLLQKGKGALTNKQLLKETAEEKAFKATGAMLKDAKLASKKQGGVLKVGRDLLDEGVVGFGDKADDIAAKATEASAKYGQDIGNVLEDVAQKGGNIDVLDVAGRIKREVVNDPKLVGSPSESTEKALQEVNDMANRLWMKNKNYSRAPAESPLATDLAHGFRKQLDADLNWTNPNRQPASVEQMRRARNILEESVEDSIGKTGGKEALEKYLKAKDKYGSLQMAEDIAKVRTNRDLANRTFSLSDYLTLTGGLASGNAAPTIVAPVANKVLRERGNSAMAATFNTMYKALEKNPKTLGKFAGVLNKAAEKSNESLALTHWLLLQNDPEYAAALDASTQSEDPTK